MIRSQEPVTSSLAAGFGVLWKITVIKLLQEVFHSNAIQEQVWVPQRIFQSMVYKITPFS